RLERGDETATRILPSLYIGPRSSASASSFITSHGISHILSIGSTPSPQVPGVIYHRLSLTDSSSESINIRRVCQKAGEIIDAVGSARRGGNILVHCSAGISRSPTVVTAYLMTRHQMTLRDALGLIVGARPSTCPNPGFLAQLKDMEEEIFGKQTMKSIEQLPSVRAERVALF
ncbi:protein-tyrosine phosphatase-like protein, partial [Crucibulum laeve]